MMKAAIWADALIPLSVHPRGISAIQQLESGERDDRSYVEQFKRWRICGTTSGCCCTSRLVI
jgi:hypothetical protein